MLQKNREQLKKYMRLSLIGFIAGLISGFFSTGGGLILVPAFLYLLGIDSQKARGTSVFCILPMVLTSRIYWSKIIKKTTRKIFKNRIHNIFMLCSNKNDI